MRKNNYSSTHVFVHNVLGKMYRSTQFDLLSLSLTALYLFTLLLQWDIQSINF